MSTLQSHYEKHPPSYLLSWSQLQNSLAAGCGHVPGSQETRGSCGSPATSIGRATAPEQAPAPARPYQGVRVKEPVKELLRRKRGHASSGAAPAPTAVVLPHQPLATYTTVGPSCLDMEGSVSAVTEEAALCAGWLSQPTPATLQPLAPWTPYTEYVPHEAVSCPYSADMYVQPVCPSYTVVGPSSVLTYASPPLITNVTTRSSATPAVGPPLEGPEHQAPLTYFPWPQPLSTLPTSTLQYQPPAPALPGPQFVQLPISIPEPVLQDMEDPRRAASSLTIDKLLLEEEDSDAYALNHTLSVEGF
ncbi:POU domain class 2-associating factor 1 isoform X1 [Homo sapiens]|uniref:POU domain class 2-associating factor 1 isoform X1 n=2 Tax=Homo sapiens TaxID=9606 RepID=UPI000387C61E|nr:POU domain class 2-associating factor 1 isoform X1 [Homo sapiens]|eukprot:XP_005271650.1 POU domain class 2-associating factor 1 isoform X1 [Homo sapiens]